jgi:drug/metabolite transporter (DMT)-like permease
LGLVSWAAGALLLVSALWGTTFVAVKSGLSDSSPLFFVGARFTLASAASAFLLRGKTGLSPALRAGVPLGIVLALAYASQTIGLETTTPARSAFVTGLNVAIVPLWTFLLLGRGVKLFSLVGLALALPGLWLLTSPSSHGWHAGDSWTVLCAFLFALHVVLINRIGPRFDSACLLVSQLSVTAVLCFSSAPILESPRLAVTPELCFALLATALFATTGTTWLQLRFQPKVEPTRAALIYATEPLFATFFSFLFTGESLPAKGWAGGGLILAGMVLSELSSRESAPPTPAPRAL